MPIRREQPGLELVDLLDRVLDKGITVEAFSRLLACANDVGRMRPHIFVESIETYQGRTGKISTAGNVGGPPALPLRFPAICGSTLGEGSCP
jgi:hypothetical protein